MTDRFPLKDTINGSSRDNTRPFDIPSSSTDTTALARQSHRIPLPLSSDAK